MRLGFLIVEQLDRFAGSVKEGESHPVFIHERLEIGRAICVSDIGPLMDDFL